MSELFKHLHTWEADPGDSALVQCKVCEKINRAANIPGIDQVRCFAEFIGFSEFFRGHHARYSRSRQSYARGAWQVWSDLRPELRELEETFLATIREIEEGLLAMAGGGVR